MEIGLEKSFSGDGEEVNNWVDAFCCGNWYCMGISFIMFIYYRVNNTL